MSQNLKNLAVKILKSEIRAVSKGISLVENNCAGKEKLIDELYHHCGRAVVWGITGPPGAGKSTLLDKIITKEREHGKKIAVIAVDPSSPFSGGAILGDRLRMQKHATDPNVFIRSMASRGHLGGIASATADAVKILDAAGFDLIVIETMGVGQSEVEVIEISDIVILVLVPGMGDEIQALKAGVMEIGDIFVINKKDYDGASKLFTEVQYVLNLKETDDGVKNPVLMTSASLNEGIDELIEATDKYFAMLKDNRILAEKRKKRIITEIKQIIAGKIIVKVNEFLKTEKNIDVWAEKIYKGEESPYSMINRKIDLFLKETESL